MKNLNLDEIEETLFVPLRGRVFASKNFNEILYDEKAIEISEKIPQEFMSMENETEYTLICSAVRSMNIDKLIKEFLEKNPTGCLINIGCGLETTFNRNDNHEAIWFEMDLKEVTKLRKELFEDNPKDNIITYSMFDYKWIEEVQRKTSGPYFLISSGVFYYFKKEEIIDVIKNIKQLGDVQLVFDTVSKFGIKQTNKYMKDLGKEDATMYFYIENTKEFINKIGGCQQMIVTDYFKDVTNKSKFNFTTRAKMFISDKFHMVSMIHLKL